MSVANQMNRRVTLQELAETKNAIGESVGTWQNVVTDGDGKLWARKRDLSGRQYVSAGGTQNEVSTEWRIRARAGVVPSMRLLHGTDIYEIVAALDQDRYLDLMCVRGASNG